MRSGAGAEGYVERRGSRKEESTDFGFEKSERNGAEFFQVKRTHGNNSKARAEKSKKKRKAATDVERLRVIA